MSNWIDSYCKAENAGISDHCPLVVCFENTLNDRKIIFRFFNIWCSHPRYYEIVSNFWNVRRMGSKMYQVYQKLKYLKPELRSLNKRDFSDISGKVNQTRVLLGDLQAELIKDPFNEIMHDEERAISIHIHKIMTWEESILRQSRKKILSVKLNDGSICKEADKIKEMIVKHFEDFNGSKNSNRQANSTIITLIPKVDCLETIEEYRPISCSNVIYKGISKIIARRISKLLNKIINSFQSDFVAGRNIADNILLAHEVVRNYHKGKGNNCALKVDIQKDYDSLEWDFIEEVMNDFSFLARFIKLTMKCIKSSMFSIMVNGEIVWPLITTEKHYFFNGVNLVNKSELLRIIGFQEGTLPVKKHGLVNWNNVCYNKNAGGLSIKSVMLWNIAALVKHIWGLVTEKASLWAKWVSANKLKRLSF
ncbi:uncharacterized protein LOC126681886 [Mercurialis annua]|uniref:uncharacterized protein LOC126681886 n=1 Tax=Mercurialis annua TaxID=3986 RepID=UPI00215E914C|nr:uncharacterized protein LOC126681886 [Mercurialis annua]